MQLQTKELIKEALNKNPLFVIAIQQESIANKRDNVFAFLPITYGYKANRH